MLKNIFKINIRFLRRRRSLYLISLVGLSLSIAFSCLIYLFVKHEYSFDAFHKKRSLIYRLESNLYTATSNSQDPYWRMVDLPAPLIAAIRAESIGLVKSSRVRKSFKDAVIKYEENVFSDRITYVDSDFFEMFTFPVNPIPGGHVLFDQSSILLTESKAKKYFGDKDPIGKIISVNNWDGEQLYQVSGVISDPPENSSLNFSFLAPIESWKMAPEFESLWNEYTYSFFVELNPSTQISDFESSIGTIVDKHMKEQLELHKSLNNIPDNVGPIYKVSTSNLMDIHWKPQYPWDKTTNSENIKILIGIALLILILASVNYISISMAGTPRRKIEIGIRKVFGSSRIGLISQFIGETFVQTGFALIFGILIMMLFLPLFSYYFQRNFTVELTGWDFVFILSMIGILSVVSGFYPAFYLSSLRPVAIFKRAIIQKVRVPLLSFLIIIQFVLFLVLGVSAIFMVSEMRYINSKDLGFIKNNVLVLPVYAERSESTQIVHQLKNLISRESDVVSVGGVSRSFFRGISNMGYVTPSGERKSGKAYSVDPDYVPTLNLQILEGRNFEDQDMERNSVILNESMAADFQGHAIGSYFKWGNSGDSSIIIGVIKNFHFRSLEYPIEPLFLTMNYAKAGPLATVLVRLSDSDVANALVRIKKAWRQVSPNTPFEFQFLEYDVQKQYESYQRWTNIITFASGFAAFIACIGLFGLAGMNTANKRQEIGIRKVFGASSLNILMLLNWKYLILVGIASVVAVPISYWAISKWTSSLVYSLPLSFESMIAFSAILGTVVVVLSVSYHSLKGSLTNPIETIRDE